jgi:hypothetical protein
VALSQTHFRLGAAAGTESTHGWLAAENFGVMLPPARAFLCRIGLQNDGTAANNFVMQWQCQHERAGAILADWTNVTTTSAVARAGATAVFANGANCTRRLAGPTGTFETSGAGCTHDGSAGGAANDVVANGCTETLASLQLIGADVQVGDIVRLRVANLAGYVVLPEIRVGVNAIAVESRAIGTHWMPGVPVARVADANVVGLAAGMSPADLADPTLTIAMNAWGTSVAGSTDPADYTVHMQGPDVWAGGRTGKAGTELGGMPIPPAFAFGGTVDTGIKRVRASFEPSRTVTFGADATIIEVPA